MSLPFELARARQRFVSSLLCLSLVVLALHFSLAVLPFNSLCGLGSVLTLVCLLASSGFVSRLNLGSSKIGPGMPAATIQCPKSLVAFFPAEVHRTVGCSQVLPRLLESVERDQLSSIQFLRNGAARLTFKEESFCLSTIQRGIRFGDHQLRLTSADTSSRLVYLRDCPFEVPDDAVRTFFSSFGQVHSVQRSEHHGFPGLSDGNRLVKMSMSKDVPGDVRLAGFDCRVWYRGQPPYCAICRKTGHRSRACPLSGRCRRCGQSGHMARECRNAWGQPAPQPASGVLPVSSRKEEQAGVPAPGASLPGTEAVEDPDVSPDAVVDDAMEGVRPPPLQSPAESDDDLTRVIILPVEYTAGSESEDPVRGSSDSPRQRRRKRKRRLPVKRYSLPSALSSPDGCTDVLDMDTGHAEHRTVSFFEGTYSEIWYDVCTWEMVRGNAVSNSLPEPLSWFVEELRTTSESSPG